MAYSTQQSIEIAGIKDGVLIDKDGSYRLILMVAATNFALKSENEQNAMIFQYQSFLNSLHFPIQILIRSKRLDLTPYLERIKGIAEKQQNELIKLQSLDYVEFVSKLINIANIMKKTFYVCVSYSTMTAPKQVNVVDKLFGTKAHVFDQIKISDQEFEGATEKLFEYANVVASGLGSLGLRCSQLSTEEAIELFYEIYNPGESSKERLANASELAAPIIASGGANAQSENVDVSERRMVDNTEQIMEKQRQDIEARLQDSPNKPGATPGPTAAYLPAVNGQAAIPSNAELQQKDPAKLAVDQASIGGGSTAYGQDASVSTPGIGLDTSQAGAAAGEPANPTAGTNSTPPAATNTSI
ncbi:MAG: hypothetical protein NTW50_01555 [Candidatus Berkelbacteria bacterium]|nr:hypothetical protein [Candidatus Berkelbacteria bacterium]